MFHIPEVGVCLCPAEKSLENFTLDLPFLVKSDTKKKTFKIQSNEFYLSL